MAFYDKWLGISNKREITNNSPEKVIDKKFSSFQRRKIDIQLWRTAVNRAENKTLPRYAELMQVYQEINDDAEVTAQFQTRFNFILSKDFKIVDVNGEEDIKGTELFKKDWFDDFTRYTLQSIPWGYSFVELGDEDILNNDIEYCNLLPRENCNPAFRTILKSPNDSPDNGISIDLPENVNYEMMISNSKDEAFKGLYSKIAPYFIFNREALIQFNSSNYRHGSGQFVGKSNSQDDKYVAEFKEYLANAKSSTSVLLGLEDSIQLLEAGANNTSSFTEMMRVCSEAICKIIIGSTSLGSEKSFVGSSDVAYAMATDYSDVDVKFISRIVNNDLIPRLINIGFKNLKGKKIEYVKEDKTADPKDIQSFIIQLLQQGKNIPNEYLTEIFGIPFVEDTKPTEPIEQPIQQENINTEDVQTDKPTK